MKTILISCIVILSLTSIMANPIEKDEDRSIGKDITEWFEKAFKNIKGAFDKHECLWEKPTWTRKKIWGGDPCHFYEDCIKHYDDYNYYTKEAYCELKTWASIIKWLLIVVAVIIVLVGLVYCGAELDFFD